MVTLYRNFLLEDDLDLRFVKHDCASGSVDMLTKYYFDGTLPSLITSHK